MALICCREDGLKLSPQSYPEGAWAQEPPAIVQLGLPVQQQALAEQSR